MLGLGAAVLLIVGRNPASLDTANGDEARSF